MQAHRIREMIDLICNFVRLGFNDQIIDLIKEEGLREMLQTHKIRFVLANIIDEISKAQSCKFEENKAMELQQTNEQEDFMEKNNTLLIIQNTHHGIKPQMEMNAQSPTYIQKEVEIQSLQGKLKHIHKHKKMNYITNKLNPIKMNNPQHLNEDELQQVDQDIDDQIQYQIFRSPPDADDVSFVEQNMSQLIKYNNKNESIVKKKQLNQKSQNINNNLKPIQKDGKQLIGQQQQLLQQQHHQLQNQQENENINLTKQAFETDYQQIQSNSDKKQSQIKIFISSAKPEMKSQQQQQYQQEDDDDELIQLEKENYLKQDLNSQFQIEKKQHSHRLEDEKQSLQIIEKENIFNDQDTKVKSNSININIVLPNLQNSIVNMSHLNSNQSNQSFSNKNNSLINNYQNSINSNDSNISNTANIINYNTRNSQKDNSNNNLNDYPSSSNISITANPIISPHHPQMNHISKINRQTHITSPLKQSYVPISPSTTPSVNSDALFRSLNEQNLQLLCRSPHSQENSPNLDACQSTGLDIGNIMIQQSSQQMNMQQQSDQNDRLNDDDNNFQPFDQSQQSSSSSSQSSSTQHPPQSLYLLQQYSQQYSQQLQEQEQLFQLYQQQQQQQTYSSSQHGNRQQRRKYKYHKTN